MAKLDTICVQGGYNPKTGEPRVTPVVKSTTFVYEKASELADLFDLKADGYFYTRLANPTVSVFENKLAKVKLTFRTPIMRYTPFLYSKARCGRNVLFGYIFIIDSNSSSAVFARTSAPASRRTSSSRNPHVTAMQGRFEFFAVLTSTSESPT